ncbi:hypothetical protein K0M31_008291 [Melipona bicolor]|uniref:Uncharacterized protein n=1 Tax=Melipona bicolor TaxID=60889 RepID=A0AA40FRB9_9HYME|nr:hypothetical protein K0M31_008291 [Melipona bicolor]
MCIMIQEYPFDLLFQLLHFKDNHLFSERNEWIIKQGDLMGQQCVETDPPSLPVDDQSGNETAHAACPWPISVTSRHSCDGYYPGNYCTMAESRRQLRGGHLRIANACQTNWNSLLKILAHRVASANSRATAAAAAFAARGIQRCCMYYSLATQYVAGDLADCYCAHAPAE